MGFYRGCPACGGGGYGGYDKPPRSGRVKDPETTRAWMNRSGTVRVVPMRKADDTIAFQVSCMPAGEGFVPELVECHTFPAALGYALVRLVWLEVRALNQRPTGPELVRWFWHAFQTGLQAILEEEDSQPRRNARVDG